MALSTLSRIRPKERHVVYPPAVLVPLASRLFEGFFDVAESGPADIVMSHLGLRHLLPGMLRGKRYYSPFYWILRETRGKLTVKDKINDLGFLVAAASTPCRAQAGDMFMSTRASWRCRGCGRFATSRWKSF